MSGAPRAFGRSVVRNFRRSSRRPALRCSRPPRAAECRRRDPPRMFSSPTSSMSRRRWVWPRSSLDGAGEHDDEPVPGVDRLGDDSGEVRGLAALDVADDQALRLVGLGRVGSASRSTTSRWRVSRSRRRRPALRSRTPDSRPSRRSFGGPSAVPGSQSAGLSEMTTGLGHAAAGRPRRSLHEVGAE